jgi:3-hydroxyisobutyrate dehydrogenase
MSKEQVAFLGLGTMGFGMASRLLDAGFPLTVYNRSADKAEPLREKGARVATSPADAAKGARLVISMVADDAASRLLWMGENGALSAADAGAVLVECSTLSVGWIRELSALADKAGCSLMDAPVTGSRVAAASGELTFLVGGDSKDVGKADAAFAAMGKGVVWLGPVGSGAQMKLINNFICGVQAASLAETLAWIERSGLDVSAATNVLLNGAPGSPLVKTLAQRMTTRDYSVNFVLKLMLKDLQYATHEAQAHALSLETGRSAIKIFEEAARQGEENLDMSAVVEQFRKQ